MSQLAETQRRLWELLTAPDGVRAALADPDRRAPAVLEGWISSDEGAPADLRLEIYANAYFERIHQVLAEDFTQLAESLGADAFNDVVTAYLCVHPPRHASLRFAGDRLADFLESHPTAEPLRRRWPWAPSLARFEWALGLAFDAQDEPTLTRDRMAALPPEDWDTHTLSPVSSLQRLHLPWNVAAARRGEDLERQDTRVLVWRAQEQVQFRELDREEDELLAGVEARASFGALCDLLATRHGAHGAPERAAAWLVSWIEAGLLAG